MLRIAFLLVDSTDLAEEVVHDAFAKVYERWDKLTNPGGYLRTCVVNRCRDLQRRRRTERRTPLPPAEQTPSSAPTSWPTPSPRCRSSAGPPSCCATTTA